MRRCGCLGLVLLAGALGGCVERRFVIESDPPGAAVINEEGKQIGFTPVDDPFVYYGAKRYWLVREGFEPLQVLQPNPAPWYQWPGVDFFTENLWPFTIRDVRRPQPFALQPLQMPNPNQVKDRAEQLRERGRALEVPPPEQAPAPGPPQ